MKILARSIKDLACPGRSLSVTECLPKAAEILLELLEISEWLSMLVIRKIADWNSFGLEAFSQDINLASQFKKHSKRLKTRGTE